MEPNAAEQRRKRVIVSLMWAFLERMDGFFTADGADAAMAALKGRKIGVIRNVGYFLCYHK